MIELGQKIRVCNYKGQILKSSDGYYVDFTISSAHRAIIGELVRKFLKIYNVKYKFGNILDTSILYDISDKLDLKHYGGLFPEFRTLEELQKFINYLNKFNLIFIK